ncbi:MAG TPA: HD domain-containing protein [Ktedonobacterales bacterium]
MDEATERAGGLENGDERDGLVDDDDDAPEAVGATSEDETDERAASVTRAHRVRADDLYGALPVSRWAQTLLDLPPFARLAEVSLSDAPGDLLFRRPFPSRLTHSLGVYYLARQARPRDRALQAAALAHDLGHGPFSHLTEPLMIERLGMDHERRGVELLRRTLAELRGPAARLLAWLDADEVAALMLGGGPEGRGQLLNGLLDYDNLDNVARFLQAAELGVPGYDPRALARELRLVPPATPDAAPTVALSADGAALAADWLADRGRVYRFLGQGERNLAMRGMLRKAVDLATQGRQIGPGFFDATDAHALWLLRSGGTPGAAALVADVTHDRLYLSAWEASAPEEAAALTDLFAHWRSRLEIEARVATEAALPPHAVILSLTEARDQRALPPILPAAERGRADLARPIATSQPRPDVSAPGRAIHLFTPRDAGRDYVRRARMAAERALGELGAIPRAGADSR